VSISEKFKNSLKNRLGHDAVSFLSHGKNYVGADLFAKGLSFISIPIFTRLLVPSDYGKVALFLSIVSVLAIVFGWGIRGAVSRYYYESTNDFNRFIPSNIVFLLIVDTILIVFLYLFRHQITSTFSFSPDLYYFALAVAMMQSIFQLYQAYLIVSKQSKSVAKLNVFHSTGVIVISIILILMMDNNRYLGKIYGSTIAIVLLFIYSSYKLIVLSEWKLNIKYVKYSLIFGIPVVFHLISQYVLSTFDRMIINQLVDEKATGLYSFAYQVGMLINIVYMGMLKSWTPIFYEKLKAKDYAGIESLSRKYALIVTMLAVLLILFSKEIVIIMADSSYYESLNSGDHNWLYVFFLLYNVCKLCVL
jgi:O-antigen/teichoic acid export membrane protein